MRSLALAAVTLALLSACAVGPDYHLPDTPVDTKRARENVRLLSARMPMTLGTRALLHPHEERQPAVRMYAQNTDLHTGRAAQEYA